MPFPLGIQVAGKGCVVLKTLPSRKNPCIRKGEFAHPSFEWYLPGLKDVGKF
jgi:hypothetical protein